MKHLVYSCLVFIYLFLFFPAHSFALKPVILTNKSCSLSLDRRIEILEDKTGTLTIHDVTSSTISKKFKPNKKNSNFGYTDSAYWVRFKLNNKSQDKEWMLGIKYPLLDRVNLYFQDKTGKFKLKKSGDLVPFHIREIKHRNVVFPLEPAFSKTNRYYIRIQTSSSMQLSLALRPASLFWEKDHDEMYLLGLFYGIMLIMILYNLIVFISVKDSSYLYIVLFIFFYSLLNMNINGLGFEYLWTSFPQWTNALMILSLGLALIFALLFCRSFLNISRQSPILNRAC